MKKSAGILLYRIKDKQTEVLLVHPGGPFFAKKDEGAWSIPKGEYNDGEDPEEAAKREFYEETGNEVKGELIALGSVKLKSGKLIMGWAVNGDLDASQVQSNSFELEWPPRSGKYKVFPEIDKAAWYDFTTAKIKLNPAQSAFIERLEELLNKK